MLRYVSDVSVSAFIELSHMLDATPLMVWVGWGGVGVIAFIEHRLRYVSVNAFIEVAHMLDATPLMGWVGWGGVKVLHIERKITSVISVVHSHPPSHYIRKHAPGRFLVMFTTHRMQNKT